MISSGAGRLPAFIGCLFGGVVFGFGALAALAFPGFQTGAAWQYGFFATAVFVAAVLLLPKDSPASAWWILPIIAMLCHVGLLFIWRLAPNLFYYQLLWIVLGVGLFLLVVHGLPTILSLQRYKYLLGSAAALLLVEKSHCAAPSASLPPWLGGVRYGAVAGMAPALRTVRSWFASARSKLPEITA